MSLPAMRANIRPSPEMPSYQSKYAVIFGDNALRFSLGEILTFNSCFARGCADLPWILPRSSESQYQWIVCRDEAIYILLEDDTKFSAHQIEFSKFFNSCSDTK